MMAAGAHERVITSSPGSKRPCHRVLVTPLIATTVNLPSPARAKVKLRSPQPWQRTTLCSPISSSWLSSNH